MKFINIHIPFLSNANIFFHKKFKFNKVYPDLTLEFEQDSKDILCRQCGTTIQYDPFEDFCLFECRLCSMY